MLRGKCSRRMVLVCGRLTGRRSAGRRWRQIVDVSEGQRKGHNAHRRTSVVSTSLQMADTTRASTNLRHTVTVRWFGVWRGAVPLGRGQVAAIAHPSRGTQHHRITRKCKNARLCTRTGSLVNMMTLKLVYSWYRWRTWRATGGGSARQKRCPLGEPPSSWPSAAAARYTRSESRRA